MAASHRRHDRRNDLSDQLSEQVWEGLKPHLPGVAGKVGGPALDNRLFLAVFECGILKFAYRRALAGSAPGLRGLEKHPSPLLPLAGPGVWTKLLLDQAAK